MVAITQQLYLEFIFASSFSLLPPTGIFPNETIDGSSGPCMMQHVSFTIDSHVLLESMMEEARHVGLCAVNHVNSLFHNLGTEDGNRDGEEPASPRAKFVCPIHQAEEQEQLNEDKSRRTRIGKEHIGGASMTSHRVC